jgi:hypothetical protein
MFDEKDKLLRRCLDSIGWMIDDIKWRYDETKGNLDNGSKGGYSPELTKAMKLRDDLENYFKQGTAKRNKT